ncbi:MAG TPA: response regulator [Bryobacteraceae bacterium]|nr:response regulator [Bryobacteraceae bacterium]
MSFRMLIVDDSDAMRTFIKRVVNMSGLEPSAIYEVGNGKEALECLASQPVDVILSDINMPVMDGEQFLKELASSGKLREIPVVIVSTDSTATQVGRALKLGARGYVKKPFTPEALKSVLDDAMATSTVPRTGAIHMMSDLGDALDTAVCETLELMCFTGLMGKSDLMPAGAALCASVRFYGDAEGMVRLTVPEDTASDLTSAFLGLDSDSVEEEHVRSVAIELTNMVCGAMLSHHAENGRFHLEQPIVPAAPPQSGAAALSRAYDIGTGLIRLDVWMQQP